MVRFVRVSVFVLIGLAALAGAAYCAGQLRASLPVISGTVRVRGPQSAVTRRARRAGIPTIRGISREDVHAPRFRSRAGSLFSDGLAPASSRRAAALVGDAASG
jgi:hypothetical protein